MMKGPLRNFAETVRAEFITTLQVPVPVQAPPQPTNEWPLAELAVRVTVTPWLNKAVQPVVPAVPAVMVQLIPAGLDLTTPLPVPRPEIVRR